jgi:hypothetical protein
VPSIKMPLMEAETGGSTRMHAADECSWVGWCGPLPPLTDSSLPSLTDSSLPSLTVSSRLLPSLTDSSLPSLADSSLPSLTDSSRFSEY